MSAGRPTLGILSHSDGFYTTRRLMESARARGLEARRIDPTRVTLEVGAPLPLREDGVALLTPDILVPRVGATLTDWGLSLTRSLVAAGAWSSASAEALALAQDKLASSQLLSAAALPVLPTIAVREPAHIADALASLDTHAYVLKRTTGTQGKGVMSAPDDAAARAILECQLADGHTMLIQPLVPLAQPRDLRVLVLAGRAHAACWRRAAPGEFRSNVHLGGTTSPAELTGAVGELAEAAARAVGLPLCGVDLIEDGDGFAILEVNGSPGVEGLERATGMDVTSDILSWMEVEWRSC